jgi:hypothetical protein
VERAIEDGQKASPNAERTEAVGRRAEIDERTLYDAARARFEEHQDAPFVENVLREGARVIDIAVEELQKARETLADAERAY